MADTIGALVADGVWDAVTLVAKSFDTTVLAALDETLFGPRQVAAVWVTPLLGLESV